MTSNFASSFLGMIAGMFVILIGLLTGNFLDFALVIGNFVLLTIVFSELNKKEELY